MFKLISSVVEASQQPYLSKSVQQLSKSGIDSKQVMSEIQFLYNGEMSSDKGKEKVNHQIKVIW